jgi:5'-methylthioadenosine phosphorylase
LVYRFAQEFPREHPSCRIGSDKALEYAIMTAPENRDPKVLKMLDAVAGRVLGGR